MAFCQECGSSVPLGAEVCPGCGVPTHPADQCARCGTRRLDESERFCSNCGYQHRTSHEPAAVSTPVEASKQWLPVLASAAAVLVVALIGLTAWRLIGDDSASDDPISAGTAAPTVPAPTSGAAEIGRLQPPTIQLGASGPLPVLSSTGEAPTSGDPAIGLAAPLVTGVTASGGSITLGPTGTATLAIVVTVNDGVEGTVSAAMSSLDDSGRIGGATALLVVSGDSDAAIDWIAASGWRGEAMIDNSGSALLDSYGVTLTPHLVAVDTNGKVAARASGVLNSSEVRLVALAAIAGATVPSETEPPSAEPPDSTTVAAISRAGTLYSNFAKIRIEPHIDSNEVTTLIDQDGVAIEVLTPNQRGWYLIRAGAVEGWIFGTFVLPPDPGLQVAITEGREKATLLDELGNPTGEANQSGPKVLVIDTSGELWEVLLPNGGTAFVEPTSMRLVR